MSNEGRPSTGPGSRRYERYEQNGEDLTTQPEGREQPAPADQTEAEAQRQHDKDYLNLNKGLPLHRGSDQATHDAVVRGLQSEEPVGTPEERARERGLSGTNHGIPEHRGFTKEDKARLEAAAQAEREVE